MTVFVVEAVWGRRSVLGCAEPGETFVVQVNC